MNADFINKHGFFVNSMPKSGTHLVKQMLKGIPELHHDHTMELYMGLPEQLESHFKLLNSLQPHQFAAGHVYHSKGYADFIKSRGIRKILIIRDPRDVLVSYTYFMTYKYPYGDVHKVLKSMKTQKERYMALIKGGFLHYGYPHPSFENWLGGYAGWLNEPVLILRFENLVGSESVKMAEITKLAEWIINGRLENHFSPASLARKLAENINPSTSLTFRSGKTGSWMNEFDEEVQELFMKEAGSLLPLYGYK
ncbi:sulfotransferase domain-containing protein [Fictibacillus aquaticus]|uniref:Sulfotransferase domain-containing protein n=1 Tax=Fictibacillus aquaticus TaxID=2021314 RepID=A0A235FEK3_9BACL|nr:sulfotransferase domain-containing protein [Fictibacillus aquaticus]OYD59195.1 hypothetical protein CGZ90_04665 [Fictibacillus aquaticus]